MAIFVVRFHTFFVVWFFCVFGSLVVLCVLCVLCVFIALLLNKRNRREFGRSLFLSFFYNSSFFLLYCSNRLSVFCRVRPISDQEKKSGHSEIIEYPKDEENEIMVKRKDGRMSKYEYDVVYKPGCTNSDVFLGVQDLCMSVLDGYNVCIFA